MRRQAIRNGSKLISGSAVLKVIMKLNKRSCDRAEVFACCIVVVE